MSRRRTASNEGVWIPSAIPFFLFGFAYYLISPALVFRFLAQDNELLDTATRYFHPNYFDASYFLDAIVILVSFLIGYLMAKAVTKGTTSIADHGSRQTSFPKILATSFGALVAYFAAAAGMSGAGFFTGYSAFNVLVLGPLSTCVFLSAWFVNYFSRKHIRLLFLSFFAVCSVFLLGWGSRMYFVLSLIALTLGLVSRNRALLRNVSSYAVLAVAGLCIVAIGIAREGGRSFGFDNLVAVLFAEPLFTSVSGSLYLEASGGRAAYGIPNDLLAAIIHFIPSAIFPGKLDLISAITFNENITSPFGAKALLVNLYSNFGFFYPIFLALVGSYYGFLSRKARYSVFYRATYFSALPVLAFLFFREDLSTIIKVVVFNGLAVPLFIALLLFWFFPQPITETKGRYSRLGIGESSAKAEESGLSPESRRS